MTNKPYISPTSKRLALNQFRSRINLLAAQIEQDPLIQDTQKQLARLKDEMSILQELLTNQVNGLAQKQS